MTDSWERLSLYENRDLLPRFFQKRHARDLSAEKAYEIIGHFAQGRGFYESARQSSELARPLLLYYGVYALSRGLILFLDARMREASLPPSHGIVAEGWQQVLSGGLDKLPDLPLVITGGTFTLLSKTTSNVERCLIHNEGHPTFATNIEMMPSTSAIQNYQSTRMGTATINTRTVVTIKMVLERLPDLAIIFATTFDSLPKCYLAKACFIPANPDEFVLLLEVASSLSEENHIRSVFGLPANVHLTTMNSPFDQRWLSNINLILTGISRSSKADFATELPSLKIDRAGKLYVVELLPDGLDLSSLSLLYLIAYAMGMLVRYYPSKWLSLQNSSKGSFAFPLMKAASKLVEERFPQLILQTLEASV